MDSKATDIQHTLKYSEQGFFRTSLWVALVGFGAGLAGIHQYDSSEGKYAIAWLLVVACAAWSGYAFFRLFSPGKPVLVLSPEGISYRIPWVRKMFIPWHEIHGVDTLNMEVQMGRLPPFWTATASDVTVILLSRRFYDMAIHVDSVLLCGPWWTNTFTPKGAMMQMALPHMLVAVEPQELRQAVEARWHAFRETSRIAALQDSSGRFAGRSSAIGLGRMSPVHFAMLAAGGLALAASAGTYIASRETPEQRLERESRELETMQKRIDADWKKFEEDTKETKKRLNEGLPGWFDN